MHYLVDSLNATHVRHMRIHCECHFHTIYHIPYYIYQKFYFWAFQKNNHDVPLDTHLHDYFIETPKNKICAIIMQLLMVPLWRLDQKLFKTNWTDPPKVNIEWATAICLKKIPKKWTIYKIFFKQMAVAHLIFTLDGGVQLFWAPFDPILAVVLLKVALGYKNLIFEHFRKIIMKGH